jgi:hypothetical protein
MLPSASILLAAATQLSCRPLAATGELGRRIGTNELAMSGAGKVREGYRYGVAIIIVDYC